MKYCIIIFCIIFYQCQSVKEPNEEKYVDNSRYPFYRNTICALFTTWEAAKIKHFLPDSVSSFAYIENQECLDSVDEIQLWTSGYAEIYLSKNLHCDRNISSIFTMDTSDYFMQRQTDFAIADSVSHFLAFIKKHGFAQRLTELIDKVYQPKDDKYNFSCQKVDKNLLISLGFQEKDLNAIKGKKEDKRLLTYRSEFYCSAVGAIAEPGPRKPNENQNENKKQKMTMIVADTMLNDYYVKVGEYNCDSLAEILRNACKTLR